MVFAFLKIFPGFTVCGGGSIGFPGSGVTVCIGLAGFIICCFNANILLSHINDTSSILCKTYEAA